MTFDRSIPRSTGIKVSFFDDDGKKVGGLTVEDANKVHQIDPRKLFYFQNGDGTEEELTIEQVNQLTPQKDLLPSSSECSTDPISCGPPLVKFFGGSGFGAAANAVISPISTSVIGFDIVNAGVGYQSPVSAELLDPCGKGSGGALQVNMEPETTTGTTGTGTGGTGTGGTGTGTGGTGTSTLPGISNDVVLSGSQSTSGLVNITSGNITIGSQKTIKTKPGNTNGLKVKNITITAPGDGYLAAPDGSLGGNERVWKEAYEGYVKTPEGGYFVVQPYRPIQVTSGSTYYPPYEAPRVLEEDEVITLPLVSKENVPIVPDTLITPADLITPRSTGTTYPVILCIEEIKVLDSGFGYRPGDQLLITPDNGTQTELVINEFGQITSVKIIAGGCGYDDFPQIRTNSPTGFNATFSPIFKVTQIDPTIPIEPQVVQTSPNLTPTTPGKYTPFNVPDNIQLVSVVDCVGKIPPKDVFDIVPR